MAEIIELLGLVLALASLGVLALRTSSTLIISLGLAASVFSGFSKDMGLPIPPDRIIMGFGLFMLLVGVERKRSPIRLRFRTEHALMLVLGAYAFISSYAVGTLFGPEQGFYGLLDRLSITAFLLFSLAPLLFPDKKARNVLLVVMVCLGAYLGVTAFLEGLGAKELTWPGYIHDENVGLHFDRARGPMAESGGFGLALFECAVAAAVAARTWETRRAKVLATVVGLLCVSGTLFTLTRSVWLGSIAAVIAVCIASREWRRRLLPATVVAGVAVGAVLLFSSAVNDQVDQRSGDQGPIWDRLNLIDASVRTIEDRPIFGLGWREFMTEGQQYFRLLPDIPQQGLNLDVHNVVLSIGAELGLVGLTLWTAVVVLTLVVPIFRRGPPEMEDWRIGLLAIVVQSVVVAVSTPFSYTFTLFFLWTWAGIVAAPRFTRPRGADDIAAGTSVAAIAERRPVPPTVETSDA